MNFGDVLYDSKERVATITLNRPERFNAISETMPGDIAAAFDHANNDDSVHVIVLTGAGRGFCGGLGCDGPGLQLQRLYEAGKPVLGGRQCFSLGLG